MSDLEYVKRLAALESFDANTFIADESTPQEVCNLVLTLALVFNDLRDLVRAQRCIREVHPSSTVVSTQLGEFYGLHAHWIRLMTGLLKALAEVIGENERTIGEPSFKKIIKSLSRTYRDAWQNTVAAALATTAKGDRFGRMIFFARNKVASHYDLKEIERGYRLMFIEQDGGPPYVSRDDAMEGTRFYFADASAERYLMHAAGAKDATEFFNTGWKVLPDIAHALREIVIHFVNGRGYAWRRAST